MDSKYNEFEMMKIMHPNKETILTGVGILALNKSGTSIDYVQTLILMITHRFFFKPKLIGLYGKNASGL